MPFNVNQFRSELVGDGARSNLFQVEMTIPSFTNVAADSSRKLTFMCKGAQLPGTTIGTVQVPYFGREVKVAGNRTYPDWAVTIINDEDFTVRNSMEAWVDALNNPVLNIRDTAAKSSLNYTVNAVVKQFGKIGGGPGAVLGNNATPIKQYTFVGLFPVDISAIELDWGNNDQIEEFQVSFAYQYWTTTYPTGTDSITPISAIPSNFA